MTSPNKLQNRYDLLFEHHKYLKEKKSGTLEQKREQVYLTGEPVLNLKFRN